MKVMLFSIGANKVKNVRRIKTMIRTTQKTHGKLIKSGLVDKNSTPMRAMFVDGNRIDFNDNKICFPEENWVL